ncbi:MAG: hypothetical protein JSV30_00255 [Candidatus Omnitrophota bacterium]|nr:MAG: hypothetical protein JSV30_00255 [Candidatus Omnitrophota bacterium]
MKKTKKTKKTKKEPKSSFFIVIAALALIIAIAFIYLNFIYLPQKVSSKGPLYLQEKTKGQVKAEDIRYIPFKGVSLKNVTILTKTKKPIFTIEQVYFNARIWPLILQQNLIFRIDLHLPKKERPLIFKGLYQIKKQDLEVNFKARNDFFTQSQTIQGTLKCLLNKKKRSDINLNITSRDLNLQGNLYMEAQDVHIEKLSAKVLNSSLELIGDAQNLPDALLNIYGNLNLDLKDLKSIKPEYTGIPAKLKLEGNCRGELYISSEARNPQIGLKMGAEEIKIEETQVTDLSLISIMEDKEFKLNKLYAKSCGGEINLQGSCKLDKEGLPADLHLNVFNLDMHKILKDITGKGTPVHGRLFTLGRLSGPLKTPKNCQGDLWVSVSGSNILKLPLFEGIVNVLRLPELGKIEFKEASGNFRIGQQAISTEDFKIASSSIVIYFKGYMDFAGNLSFTIQPTFSQSYLASTPSVGNILGILIDSTGTFLGEIEMKGTIKEPRYTFRPISMEKLLPRGIEEGIKQFFKFRKKKE